MTTSQDNILLAKQFGMIFTEYYSVVKYFAFMLLKSEEDAEDIAQDVFTKLWTQPEIWTKVPNLKPYVYTLTKSTTLNFIKHKKIELAYQEKVIEKSLIEELSQTEDPLNAIYYKEVKLIIQLTLTVFPNNAERFLR